MAETVEQTLKGSCGVCAEQAQLEVRTHGYFTGELLCGTCAADLGYGNSLLICAN